MTALRRLVGDRKAATAVEYGLILAFIVIAMIVALRAMADATTGMWGMVSDTVSSVMG
ncbi:Flp family type IVb pilin [Sphingomonas cannabina]|uniref:Flp family type IVb pilin n=1 Tax=Sphingomonas cannabina TaxID=2899123 RepID=UPI001F3A9DFD|nr:Flp family type IVb pilin [Sphingomonas cannabina]UIJ44078.1 Flp family type IVb pilin [Sphingomonas cannabina]